MKKSGVIILLVILVLSVVCFWGYVVMDQARTDRQPPVITIGAQELILSVKDPQSALLADVTAMDAVDGDLTDAIMIESIYGITEDHHVTVTYVVCDRSGNAAKLERLVQFSDYRSPRFVLDRALAFEYGTIYDVMASVGAQDVIDGDIPNRVKATMLSSGVTVTEEGTHDVQFRVTNSLGDTAQLVLPVEIYPSYEYDCQVELTEYILYLSKGARFDPMDYLVGMDVRGDSIDLTDKENPDIKLRIRNTVNTDVPGVYPVAYTVVYTQDAHTYTGYSKLLVVVEG